MTITGNSGTDRRNRTREVIDKLLEERRELLALLFDSSSFDPVESVIERERLKKFCEILVDYIAAGHFGLYQRLSDGTERRAAVQEIAVRVFPLIKTITDNAAAFSDRCAANNYQRTDEIMTQLSSLAEDLSVRFELEDQLIDVMI
jgi:regulator of sigma D